jgi:hypothetical protein
MVQVKRTWSKNSQISEHNELLDTWDTGSHIFERWPNGDESYWRVISREETNDGFTETLERMPLWQMPAQIVHRAQMPVTQISGSHFQMGSWKVEVNTCIIDVQKKEHNTYNRGKRNPNIFVNKQKI